MALVVGLGVWALIGVIAEVLGGAFFSGIVFLLGGFLGAIASGLASAFQKRGSD